MAEQSENSEPELQNNDSNQTKNRKKSDISYSQSSEEFVEADFEDILTGTGFKKNIDVKKVVDKSSGSGVEYDESWEEIKSEQSAEASESEAESSILNENQLAKLKESGEGQNVPKVSNPSDRNSGFGENLSDSQSDSDIILDLVDYVKNRKKLFGGFPDLQGVDLAGRLFIDVVVKIEVEASGVISGITIIKSSGSAEIDNAIKRELRYWKFERISGSRVESPKLKLQWRPLGAN